MRLLALYHRALFVTVLLGILAYSVAEENLSHFLLAVPVSLVAWVLRAGREDSVLPRWALNLALVGATSIMAWSWLSTVGDLIGVLCRYVIWLQLIKMFETRSARDQAQIITMSAMVVVGACLTSVTAELGLVLVLYLPTLLTTVVLYQLFSGQQRQWRNEARRTGSLAGMRSPAQHGPGASVDLLRTLCVALLLVISVGAAAFIAFPRGLGDVGLGGWQPIRPEPVTGFRDHVQLGAQGLLNESRRAVMEMTVLASADPGASGRVHLLRGAVLDRYDRSRGVWFRGPDLTRTDMEFRARSSGLNPPYTDRGPFYLLRFAMYDQPMTTLFSKWRPLEVTFETSMGRSASVRRNDFDGAITLTGTRVPGLVYRVLSSPTAESPSGPLPQDPPTPVPERAPRTISLPRTFHSTPIQQLARTILQGQGIDLSDDDRDVIERAGAAFQNWLRRECVYTTELVAPDDGQDPIEMFLFDEERGRRGHCEYFASAMAAMCQSVEIPARVITGYVASEYNAFSGSYTVRENHAHAWVEVEVRPGRWTEFDPSPSAEIARLHSTGPSLVSGLRYLFDLFQIAWVESVVAFDRNRQAAAIRGARQSPSRLIEGMSAALGLDDPNAALQTARPAERTVSVGEALRPILAVIGITAFILIAGWALVSMFISTTYLRSLAAWTWLALPRRRSGRPDHARAAINNLYVLSLASLRRARLEKPVWRAPLEHARAIAEVHPGLAGPVEALSRLYYGSRFSGRAPTPDEVNEAERWAREISASCRAIRRSAPAALPA